MPHYQIQWVKLEKRLLNDYRFYTMRDAAQLLYIKLLLMAAETGNRIPKKTSVLALALRSNQTEVELLEYINEIKAHFPKLKENHNFYYFSEFDRKHNWVAPKEHQGSTEVAIDKIREDKIRTDEEGGTTKIGNLTLKNKFLMNKKEIYPMLDVEGEIRKCQDWHATHGTKVRSWERTIGNWLKIAYDSKGVVQHDTSWIDKYKKEKPKYGSI